MRKVLQYDTVESDVVKVIANKAAFEDDTRQAKALRVSPFLISGMNCGRLSRREAPICKRFGSNLQAACAKTKNLPQASASHHRAFCQDKNLTTSIREPSPGHLPRQKPYHKHLPAITGAFAKTKTLPQASASHR